MKIMNVYIVNIIKYYKYYKYMKTYLGGKLIGQGAHGCIFDKQLNCNASESLYKITLNRFKHNLITKMSLENVSGESLIEWDISTLLKTIPNYSKYFRIPISNCVATISKEKLLGESNAELNECKLYKDLLKMPNLDYNKDAKNYILKDSIGDSYMWPLRLYFSEKADVDFDTYLKNIKKNYIEYLYLPFIIQNIYSGIIHLHNIYIIHSDIKTHNLLINYKDNNYNTFMNFYNNITLCRISDFGISKDALIFSEKNISIHKKTEFINSFCKRFKFSYIILPPEFNIISHLVKYNKTKTKNELIYDITDTMNKYKLPFWDLKFIVSLVNRLYNKDTLDYNKVFKYFKIHWKKFDIYSFGLLIYVMFSNIDSNIIINTTFGIFDYNIFKNTYIELATNLCNINPSKRYDTTKINIILITIIDRFIYKNNNSNSNSNLFSNTYNNLSNSLSTNLSNNLSNN